MQTEHKKEEHILRYYFGEHTVGGEFYRVIITLGQSQQSLSFSKYHFLSLRMLCNLLLSFNNV